MRPYPAYKDSGVEWLGEVPEGWEVKRLRHLVRVKTDKATTATNPIALENIESWSGRITPTDTEFQGDGTAFEAGDILFGKLRPYLAKVAIAHCSGEAVGDFHVLRPSAGVLPRFIQLGLLTPSVISIIDGSTYGSKMPRASWDFMADLCFALPPLPEQQAIARFLDKEVAKIDALVAEQRRLIALLAEKRQAVISHAVTKGLNPATPLKPSGIDWLGDIPEGWEVVRLKADLAFLTSGSRGWADFYSDDGALFIRIGNLTREAIGLDLSDIQRVTVPSGAEGERTRIRPGDLLFSITAFLGSVAVVPDQIEDAYVSQHVALARLCQKRLLPEWVAYVTLSSVGKSYLASKGYGGTKVQLGLDDIGNLTVTCPPVAEQQEIITFLRNKLTAFDALTTAATSAISLLQERRAALISAAVTGKIDLRPHFAQSLSEPETA